MFYNIRSRNKQNYLQIEKKYKTLGAYMRYKLIDSLGQNLFAKQQITSFSLKPFLQAFQSDNCMTDLRLLSKITLTFSWCCPSSTSSIWRLCRCGSWKWRDLEYLGYLYCVLRTCRCMWKFYKVSGNVNPHEQSQRF